MSVLVFYCGAACSLATFFAYRVGFRRGKAVGWCEHHFAAIAKDRSRRNRLGQFTTPKEAGAHDI